MAKISVEPLTYQDYQELNLMPTRRLKKLKPRPVAEVRAALASWEAHFGQRPAEEAAHEWRALSDRADIARLVETKLQANNEFQAKLIYNLVEQIRDLQNQLTKYHYDKVAVGEPCWWCRRRK